MDDVKERVHIDGLAFPSMCAPLIIFKNNDSKVNVMLKLNNYKLEHMCLEII